MHLPATHEIRLRTLPSDRPAPERAKVAEVARDMMRVEEARGEAIRTRASGLLGSCGVLLTLTVGLGDSALRDAGKLGRVGEPLAATLGIAGVLFLFAAAALSALVFAPSRSVARNPIDALRAYSEVQFRTDDDETLAGEAKRLLHEARNVNLVRGRRLLCSIGCFVLGLLCLASEAAIVGLHRL
jgi:hypothetical protein